MITASLEHGAAVAAKRNIRADGHGQGDRLRVVKGMVGEVLHLPHDDPTYARGRVPVLFKGHKRRTWCRPDDLEAL